MPINRVTKNGKPGYRYGTQGKVYTYKAGNVASRKRAKKLAVKQAMAISYRTKTEPHL